MIYMSMCKQTKREYEQVPQTKYAEQPHNKALEGKAHSF